MPNLRQSRIANQFSAHAHSYEGAAPVQKQIATQLAERIAARCGQAPRRILEIGCGTGLLSTQLAQRYPASTLVLTDISPAMLEQCRQRTSNRHSYRLLDGENPTGLSGKFDLIASSLAFQWFTDLPASLQRLSQLLAPGGIMMFATLGAKTFTEWRQAHTQIGLRCGTPEYPDAANFPFPATLTETFITQPYANGLDFARSLKTLGAGEPAPNYQPLPACSFRRLLNTLNGRFAVTYHVLYGEVFAGKEASFCEQKEAKKP